MITDYGKVFFAGYFIIFSLLHLFAYLFAPLKSLDRYFYNGTEIFMMGVLAILYFLYRIEQAVKQLKK